MMTDVSDGGPDMDDKPRNERSGRFEQEVTDEEIVDIVAELELAKTADVAEKIGFTRPGTFRRLTALEEQGKVQSKDLGNNRIWLPADAEFTPLDGL